MIQSTSGWQKITNPSEDGPETDMLIVTPGTEDSAWNEIVEFIQKVVLINEANETHSVVSISFGAEIATIAYHYYPHTEQRSAKYEKSQAEILALL